MFEGSTVALITPMSADGQIDYGDLGALIDFHVSASTEALVIAGTTGESATLAKHEHIDLISRACELADGRIPIIAGTGSNSTAQTLDLSVTVDALPVAGFLVVTPYYNKPNQEGLYRHFAAVADTVERPVILYNVPGRTGVDLLPETIARLARHPNIVAVKEATGDVDRVEVLRNGCGEDFALLSGDDATSAEFMLLGGDGCISVTANVAPKKMRALCDAARAGRHEEARRIDAELRGLHRALFLESNPIPVKWAMAQMGFSGPGIRLPLISLANEYHNDVRQAMSAAGVDIAAAA
ncbi:MAG: 4-hydroxy-tetrahydrodipicolinate synthase [Gammaproteobacteria bacterium]|nr:4-hydroxy-tetrahydrodipicolinate synthase [Gammaproteobacteria bacterium]MDH3507433.1 4-hydroxy-tetrahydrodipicolinate synthase [Gammaproteobacteria bacterium]